MNKICTSLPPHRLLGVALLVGGKYYLTIAQYVEEITSFVAFSVPYLYIT